MVKAIANPREWQLIYYKKYNLVSIFLWGLLCDLGFRFMVIDSTDNDNKVLNLWSSNRER